MQKSFRNRRQGTGTRKSQLDNSGPAVLCYRSQANHRPPKRDETEMNLLSAQEPAAPTGGPAVEIHDLDKAFPAPRRLPPGSGAAPRLALAGITLTVPRGQSLAILGPNGAGKSTLLRILATLVRPSRGQVRILGHDLRDSLRVRRLVGWATGDDRAFYWPLTGQANLEFFAALYGLRGAAGAGRIRTVLGQVGLAEVAGVAYRAYSSGMRQRLALARALLHAPPVLLLDEPTRSLDPEAAAGVRALLRTCQAAGQTLLWVTHDPAEAAACCDRAIWLRAGSVVADGAPAALAAPAPAPAGPPRGR